MSKREKILLYLGLAVLLYGVIDFLVLPKVKQNIPSATANVDVAALTKDIQNTLASTVLTKQEEYILEAAAGTWERDPFYDWPGGLRAAPKVKVSSGDGQLFTYMGYVEIGDVRLAIVNGHEYQAGEELVGGSYIVSEISPSRVVLTSLTDKQELVVPYAEDGLVGGNSPQPK